MNSLKLPFNFNTSIIEKESFLFSKPDYYHIYNPSITLKTLWAKHLTKPNTSIKPHRSVEYDFKDGKARIHIPIKTNNDATLSLDNIPVSKNQQQIL